MWTRLTTTPFAALDRVLDAWGGIRDTLRGLALFEISNTGVVLIYGGVLLATPDYFSRLGAALGATDDFGWAGQAIQFAVLALGFLAFGVSLVAGIRELRGVHTSPRMRWRRAAMLVRAVFLFFFGVAQLLVASRWPGAGLVAIWLAVCCAAGEVGQEIEAAERSSGHG